MLIVFINVIINGIRYYAAAFQLFSMFVPFLYIAMSQIGVLEMHPVTFSIKLCRL